MEKYVDTAQSISKFVRGPKNTLAKRAGKASGYKALVDVPSFIDQFRMGNSKESSANLLKSQLVETMDKDKALRNLFQAPNPL